MASTIDRIKSDLLQAVNASQRKTSAYDTEAEVVRIEGNTAWVHIGGGVAETPVQLTINAQKGDKVQVRVSNEGAWIIGNATAPPTDDTKAEEAQEKIAETETVVEEVRNIAEQTQKIAGNTNQYFWQTESGTDTGAHITEIPQDDFIADPQNGGGNLLARSNGIAARNGLTELATFGASGSQIGLNGESHLSMDYHSMQSIDKEGTTYFYVSDLRDRDGYAELTEVKEGYGYADFAMSCSINSPSGYSPTATVNGNAVAVSGYYANVITLASAPAVGSTVVITYKTQSIFAKAYTAGIRNSTSYVGALSYAEGYNTIADDFCSHAEGSGTSAGLYSHAEGVNCVAEQVSHAEGSGCEAIKSNSHAQNNHTLASSENQTALGKYNTEDNTGTYAVIIGNGTSDDARSNALTVDWNGNVNIPSGASYQVNGVPIGDFVVEQGTSGIWTYRKWNSGIAECWGTYEFASASFTASGQVFYRTFNNISFPSGLLVALPHIECSVQMGNVGGCTITNRSTSSVSIAVLSSVSAARSGNIFIKAIGAWK